MALVNIATSALSLMLVIGAGKLPMSATLSAQEVDATAHRAAVAREENPESPPTGFTNCVFKKGVRDNSGFCRPLFRCVRLAAFPARLLDR